MGDGNIVIEKANENDLEWIAQFQIHLALETENVIKGVKRFF